MGQFAIPAMLLLAAAPAVVASAPEPAQVETSTFTFHQRVIIRIPRMQPPPPPPPRDPHDPHGPRPSMPFDAPPIIREKDAPKCMSLDHVRGAAIAEPDSIDLMMDNGDRIRAMLADDCPALGFYSGFYLRQSDDGKICAERDSIRSRSGASCPIQRFRKLVTKR